MADKRVKKCPDCKHDKLRYCVQDYKGFGMFSNARNCPGFEKRLTKAKEGK